MSSESCSTLKMEKKGLRSRRLFSIPFFSFFFLALVGCSTLEKSRFDDEARIQGFYSCPPFPLQHTPAQNPTAVIARCWREDLTVNRIMVHWRRNYYDDSFCKGSKLGLLRWKAKILELKTSDDGASQALVARLSLLPPRLEFIRINPHWYYDEKSGLLPDLGAAPLDQPLKMKEVGLIKKHPMLFFFLAGGRAGFAQSATGSWQEDRGKEARPCAR